MKSTEMLKQIKTLLNLEVKLEDMKLENGTVISADSLKKVVRYLSLQTMKK